MADSETKLGRPVGTKNKKGHGAGRKQGTLNKEGHAAGSKRLGAGRWSKWEESQLLEMVKDENPNWYGAEDWAAKAEELGTGRSEAAVKARYEKLSAEQTQQTQQEKMCEDCCMVQAHFGLPDEREKRWCGGCGKDHGTVRLQNMCEDCGRVCASFGLPGERTYRLSSHTVMQPYS